MERPAKVCCIFEESRDSVAVKERTMKKMYKWHPTISEIKAAMETARSNLLRLGDMLNDYPEKKKEVYGAADILKQWIEEIE